MRAVRCHVYSFRGRSLNLKVCDPCVSRPLPEEERSCAAGQHRPDTHNNPTRTTKPSTEATRRRRQDPFLHMQWVRSHTASQRGSVTTISPRLGRPERPSRDLLYQVPWLVLWIDYASHAAISRANPASDALPAPSFNRSQLPVAPIRVLLMFSKALATFCDDTVFCSTR